METKVKFDIVDLEQNVNSVAVSGDKADVAVKDLINSHDVIVFSKTTCPFCFELKRTLSAHGVSYAVFEVDLAAGGMASFQQALRDITSVSTVPQLFVKGFFVGGCEKVKELEFSGALYGIIAPFISTQIVKPADLQRFNVFYVPEAVNNIQVRIAGSLVSVYSILCCAFYKHEATPWAVLALAIDFTLRFFFGGSVSVIGLTAELIAYPFTPIYKCSAPKVFATFCGVFFSVFAAGLFLGGSSVGGAIVIILLAAAAGMEGVLDFCAGCVVFSYLVRFGLVPKTVYSSYLHFKEFRLWAWRYANSSAVYPKALSETICQASPQAPSPVDLIGKKRDEAEYKMKDFDLIRHARIELFGCPMAVATLAFAFQLGGNSITNWNNTVVYQTLAIVSVVLFLALFFVYLTRAVLYPSKIRKEWAHPTTGNFFSCISITVIVFGVLLLPDDRAGGISLIWIGSILQMIIAVFKISDLVYDRVTEDMINPSLLMAPVGNFVAAFAFAWFHHGGWTIQVSEIDYTEIARLWFSIAAFFAVVLFTITFRKAMHDHHSDNRLRPMLWIWLATSSIAGPAYLAVSGFDESVGKGVLYQSLWTLSLFFFTLNAIGWVRNFFGYVPDMSIWVMSFSLSVFAANTVQYLTLVNSHLFQALSLISFSIACASTAVCGLHTVNRIVDGTLFTPKPKWGPISFMKLTHEAFRFAIPKYELMLKDCLTSASPYAINGLLAKIDCLLLLFAEHARHEKEVLFPAARRYFPDLNKSVDEEHRIGEQLEVDMLKLIKDYRDGVLRVTELVPALLPVYSKWASLTLPHLRNEENSVTIAIRKYIPPEEMIEITKTVYQLTPSETWRKILPFVIENLPLPVWKTRYVKTFVWAVPFRAQEIGMHLYLGVDAATWQFVAQELPEIIP